MRNWRNIPELDDKFAVMLRILDAVNQRLDGFCAFFSSLNRSLYVNALYFYLNMYITQIKETGDLSILNALNLRLECIAKRDPHTFKPVVNHAADKLVVEHGVDNSTVNHPFEFPRMFIYL